MKSIITLVALLTISTSFSQTCLGPVSDLTISTGWNPVTSAVINDYDFDPMWRLVQAPADPPGWTSNIGGPAISIPITTSWVYAGANSKYVNAYPTAQALTDNWNLSTTQYIFEREFCVCGNNPNQAYDITFDLSLNADNWAEVYLEDEQGNQTLLVAQPYVYSQANFLNTPSTVNVVHQLTPGTYKLQLHHRNKQVVMGVNLDGKIYSNALISDNSCVKRGSIAGYSREDANSNGILDASDPKSQGWTMELRNTSNTLISSIVSDHSGYYFFMDVDPGTYTVTGVPPTGLNVIVPTSASYTVTVEENVVAVSSFLGTPNGEEPDVTVEEFCILDVPNVFTPNGDQVNDKFYFSTQCNVPIDAKIMNRWGNVVYESTDVAEGWDGTSKGQAIAAGAYFYSCVVKYTDKEDETVSGYVQVIR
ncbi:MAG: gliding motility-associated-like protein [Crocinitomicaceae bacterium]|jgi:gliding motility-associated-like protein